MEVKGINALVIINENQITIQRKPHDDKVIDLESVSSVKVKQPGITKNGYIRLVLSNINEIEGDLFNPAKDEYTVIFGTDQVKEFELLITLIETKIT